MDPGRSETEVAGLESNFVGIVSHHIHSDKLSLSLSRFLAAWDLISVSMIAMDRWFEVACCSHFAGSKTQRHFEDEQVCSCSLSLSLYISLFGSFGVSCFLKRDLLGISVIAMEIRGHRAAVATKLSAMHFIGMNHIPFAIPTHSLCGLLCVFLSLSLSTIAQCVPGPAHKERWWTSPSIGNQWGPGEVPMDRLADPIGSTLDFE